MSNKTALQRNLKVGDRVKVFLLRDRFFDIAGELKDFDETTLVIEWKGTATTGSILFVPMSSVAAMERLRK